MPLLTFSHGSVELNDEQAKVVQSHPFENQRILASAGSGKTTTITARIANLIEHYNIQPQRILLVTFSRAAAQEMIHRVYRLAGHVPIYAGTFHALSAQILREEAPLLLRDQPFIDELPYRLVEWLQTIRGKQWAQRFRTIIIDEFQDINDIQWKLIQCFKHPYSTTTIVGDDAQNIYTWRGSSVDFLLNFHEHYWQVKDYQLCTNYRSAEPIVTIANSVMRFIPTLSFKEKMVAYKKSQPHMKKPDVHFFFRSSDEYDWIVNSIEKAYKQYTQDTFAVLSRYNSDLYKIEERLHKKGIIYNLCTQYDPDRSNQQQKRITLATIHASKGLEWDHVYFMNLNDDIFPSLKSDEEIVCERRLFYVGVTRAKNYLCLTYSKHERSICRFIREIPRPFIQFHNVASFTLSTIESLEHQFSIEDMIQGFDGKDWNDLRISGHIPNIKDFTYESIYNFSDLFSIPEWVKETDTRETWLEVIRFITFRESAKYLNKMESLRTPEVAETLLTLRVYKEDLVFWEEFQAEMELLVYHFLKYTQQMPAIEFYQVEEFMSNKLPHLKWTTQQLSHAVMILAKIRGQLRPLRHKGFDLNDFSFGYVRNSVPTELRPVILTSWKRILDVSKTSHEILEDIWRIASLKSVMEGRNIPLYKCDSITPYLYELDTQRICQAIEKAILRGPSILQESSVLNCIFKVDNMKPIHLDILTDKCAYTMYFDGYHTPDIEDKIVLLLKQYVYEELFDRCFDTFGFLNMATGIITRYDVTAQMREKISNIWKYMQVKYNI